MPAETVVAVPLPTPPPEIIIFPGLTIASPTTFAADFGTVYAGAGFQARARYLRSQPFPDGADGALMVGFGLGRAEALALDVALTSYSTLRSGLLDRAALSLELHRMLGRNAAVGIGWENAIMRHASESDGGNSIYGVVTRLFQLRPDPTESLGLLTVTAGVGNGRFRTEEAAQQGRRTVGVFGAAALTLARPVAVVADWTGQDLALGASIAPLRRVPFVITPAWEDVLGIAGDGARFVLSVGLGHRLGHGPIQF